jgi:tRNA A37 threonylcarbamoyladenosine dehydratase
MRKKSSRGSKGSKKISPLKRKCNQYLSRKIRKNLKEKIYKSRQQAIAVAYSQTKKSIPKCKRFYKK